MLRMAVGHSDDVDAADAIAIAIDQCRDQLDGLAPQAGFLVAAFDSFDPSLVATVRDAFPGCALMGSTSSAEMSSTSGYLEDSVSLALFASDDIDITAGLGLGLDRDVDGACRAAIAEARSKSDRDPKICVVFADAGIVEPQRTLDALAAALPDGVVVVGGGSAWHDVGSGAPSWQFCNERVTSEGVAVLLFSGPVAYSIAVGTGWRSLGASGVITRSAPRQIDEIDGRPAVEFLARYLDVTGPAAFGNPLAVREVGANESYLRAVTGSDASSGALSVLGLDPRRLDGPAHDRDDRGHPVGHPPVPRRGDGRLSGGNPAGSGADVLLRRPADAPRLQGEHGGRARPNRARPIRRPGRAVLLRRDRSGLGRVVEPLPQLHVRDPPARNVTNPPAADSEPDESEAALRKEAARLARRVGQLETTLREVELARDANTGLLDRIMAELEVERARSRDLLLNILPQSIIDRLNGGERVIADRFDDVAVVFSDFVGFTEISARLPVATVVSSLNEMFSGFDAACAALGVEKIKTIGDAYLAAAGLPRSDPESDSGSTAGHIHAAADLALTMLSVVDAAGPPWRIRIGIHNGPVVAGVIGTNKFVYDLWGDAVNVASRLEASSEPGRIQVSASIAAATSGAFVVEPRGQVDLKGKGSTETFFLLDRRDGVASSSERSSPKH